MAETIVPEKTFTNEEKLHCIAREVKMRRQVYSRRVALGQMSAEKADRELALMEAIGLDYQKLVISDRLL